MSCQPCLIRFTPSGKCCISNLREAAEKWLWKTQKTPENWRVVDDDAGADAAGIDHNVDSNDTNDIDDTDNRTDDYDDNDDDDNGDE